MRRAAAESAADIRRSSPKARDGDGGPAPLEPCDNDLASRICNSILRERYKVDPDRSSKALRVWDAVARCLEEISDSIDISSSEDSSAGRYQRINSSCNGEVTKRPQSSSDYRHSRHERSTSNAGPRVQYPCPFRKRNPARFNVRDYERCAKSPFDSMTELKHHIAAHHRRKDVLHQCRRCKFEFESDAALDEHIMRPRQEMCELNSTPMGGDPEHGITEDMAKRLVCDIENIRSWTWENVWRFLFPGDRDVPNSDFLPIVELIEVEQESDRDQEVLKASLQEKLGLLLPGVIEDDYCRFLAGQLELVFEIHQANIVRKCLNRVDSATTSEEPAVNHPKPTTQRQTRRSRRSTLFFTIAPDDSYENDQTSRQFSSYTERTASTSFFTNRSTTHSSSPREEATGSPSTPSSNTSFSSGDDDTNENDYATGRDSRDSGIGIPCDVCELESCGCREMILSYAAKDSHNSDYGCQAGSENQGPEALLSRRRKQPSLRHQPNLRVETRGIDVLSLDGREINTAEGFGMRGAFSPQSFKQRVMRKQQPRSSYGMGDGERWTA
ncbi:hypothetical protein B0H63DRAFT_523805 [Podospora didyma]|uniref:C2H2-type domain-containing protein n=1 Tax=Podospora didyma TaxID=330526 RepID=A0AAE0NGH7_9PEZI|nr:hypothetical protein B0H63DRAFT_523805 [Podospora didyma]